MTQVTESSTEALSCIVYDKVTGRPLGRHRHFDAMANKMIEVDEAEALALFAADDGTLEKVTDSDAANLAVLKAGTPITSALRGSLVVKNRLVRLPKLALFSDQPELVGDGKSTATLTITLQDEQERVINAASNEVVVTTTRGKLSVRAGRCRLKNGRATLTLTSVPETVQDVRVQVELAEGLAEPAEVRLAFV